MRQSIHLLEDAILEGTCDIDSDISMWFVAEDSQKPWYVTCEQHQQGALFSLGQTKKITGYRYAKVRRPDGSHCTKKVPTEVFSDAAGWPAMTKDQLLHKFANGPDIASARTSYRLDFNPLPYPHQMKAFAQNALDLLCTTKGMLMVFLVLPYQELEESPGDLDEGHHRLTIWHVADPSGVLFWEIDGKRCIVDPPRIKCEDMPCRPRDRSSDLGAIHIWAEFNISPDDGVAQDSVPFFLHNSQTVRDIAYKGNVSIDACA